MFRTKVVDKIKTHILFSVTFFFENRAVYKEMWISNVERGRPQMTIWHMRIACWLPKARNTHTHTHTQTVQYSLLFHSNNGCTNASPCYLVRHTYIACLVFSWFDSPSGPRPPQCHSFVITRRRGLPVVTLHASHKLVHNSF